MSTWLTSYYGEKWTKELHPSVVFDGKDFAVVRVTYPGKQSYVIVRKTSTHDASTHLVIHEGLANEGDYARMRAALAAKDRR
jgi:hypothetical protein